MFLPEIMRVIITLTVPKSKVQNCGMALRDIVASSIRQLVSSWLRFFSFDCAQGWRLFQGYPLRRGADAARRLIQNDISLGDIKRYRVKESLRDATHRSGLDDLDPGSEAGVTMVRAG